jgi:hypothetical protein
MEHIYQAAKLHPNWIKTVGEVAFLKFFKKLNFNKVKLKTQMWLDHQ